MDKFNLICLATGADETDIYLSADETTVLIVWTDGRAETVSAADFFGKEG